MRTAPTSGTDTLQLSKLPKSYVSIINLPFSMYPVKIDSLPKCRTPRALELYSWPPSSYQTERPCLGKPGHWRWSRTEVAGLSPWSSGTLQPHPPRGNRHNVSGPSSAVAQHWYAFLTALTHLIIRHLENIAEAASADIVRDFICDLECVLESGPPYCCHVWARKGWQSSDFLLKILRKRCE